MPQFKKNKKSLKMRKRRRSFSSSGKTKKTLAGDVEVVKYESNPSTKGVDEVVKKPIIKEELIIKKLKTTKNKAQYNSKQVDAAKKEISAAIKKNETIEEIDKEVKKAKLPVDEAEAQLDEIDRIIKNASKHLDELTQENEEVIVEEEEPTTYNGVSDTNEHLQLLEEQLKSSHKQSQKLKHEIDLLKVEFDEEKKQLQSSVKSLRKELHRTEPIQDNKFFTLSKELREAVTALEEITNTTTNVKVDLSQVESEPEKEVNFKTIKVVKKSPDTNVNSTVKETIEVKSDTKMNKTTPTPPVKKDKIEKEEPKEIKADESKAKKNSGKKKGSKKKKMLITGGAAVAVLVVMSGLISSQLFGETSVDDALVQEYLSQPSSEGGDVAGATTEEENSEPSDEEGATAEKKTVQITKNGNGGVEVDASQLEVDIDGTIWETYEDSNLGVKLQYPINAVKLSKTDSNTTLQRGNGYIFKIQKIETGLDLNEYWKQIQATNLNYKATNTTLDEQEAIFLELQEEADFPGDRYLVKMENAILDIWYATPSKRFDNDDMLRVERVLKTLSFLTE